MNLETCIHVHILMPLTISERQLHAPAILAVLSCSITCVSTAAGALAAHACTSGTYQDPQDPQIFVSWRFLDLPATYFNNMTFVPAGSPMALLPVSGRNYSSLGKEITVKRSFICQTSSADAARILVAAAEPGLIMDPESGQEPAAKVGTDMLTYTPRCPAALHPPLTAHT
jgi:hypothetical protein